ncbi:MAG TPA: DUF885 domain-containing protein [Solirubrobacteraceae bacterium]|nr:DUF885 domain-containing protein [Solirubrobacteraceae bacterium]
MVGVFGDLVRAFVDGRHALDPVAATIAGIHDHDARIGDFSEAGFAAREAFVDEWLRRFEVSDPASLAPEEGTDRELILSDLRGQLALRPFERWRRQPSLYSDAIVRGAYYALLREGAPLEDRLIALAERLERGPAVLDQARANLDPERVPPVWVVVAGETASAGATFVRALVPAAAPDGAPSTPALIGAGKRAGDALDAYASWLRDDLMRRARGTFAIGTDAFEALLRDRELLEHDVPSLRAFGQDLYRETEAKLAEAARALGDSDWRASVQRLREDHPSEEELVAAYRYEMERSRQATMVAQLATLPEGESLEVEAMPDFSRSTYPYAAYVAPGPFERSRHGRFWVTLPLPGEPTQVRRERLEGHPRRGIAVIACHEGYPGHHLQLSRAADVPSLARKALRSNVFIEGWGLYVEELMSELGYLDDPETRVLRLKDLLWRAARVLVDVGLATGELNFEGAVRLLVDGPKLERPNAVGEVRRYTFDPLQPSSYALGRASLLDLRKKAKRAGWGMREFHDRVLSVGSLPPPLVARETGLL